MQISCAPRSDSLTLSFILLMTLTAQFILMAVSFPISDLLTEKPLLYIDNAMHWYQVRLAVDLAASGVAAGYDPFFAAGYLGGVTYNISARLPALIAVIIGPSVDVALLWKLYVFGLSLLAPLCPPLAARVLRASPVCTAAVALLGLLLWWTCYFQWFYTAGMVSFVAACYFSMLYAAWMWQYLMGKGSTRTLLGLGFAAGVILFFHPCSPIPIIAVIAWMTLLHWQDLPKWRIGVVLLVVPAISLSLNAVWITPILSSGMYWGDVHTKEMPHLGEVDLNFLWQELLGRWTGRVWGSRIYPPIAILAFLGVLGSDSSQSRRLWASWLLAGISVEILRSIGGDFFWIARMEPYRFSPVGYLLMVAPAGRGLEWAASAVYRAIAARRRLAVCAVVVLLLAACFGFLIRDTMREVLPGNHARIGPAPPYVREVGPKSRWVIEWIKSNTDQSARILFETAQGRFHDGAHIAGYVADLADREMIGGIYPHHHFAGFWDGMVFGRPIKTLETATFRHYLDLYNIGWIIAFSQPSRNYLATAPNVKLASEFEGLAAYHVNRPFSFFHLGDGRVTARQHNRIDLDGLSGTEVIVRYHFLPGLKSRPAARIEPVFLEDDPVPFIRILNPPQSISIFVEGLAPRYDSTIQNQVSSRVKP
ncbi:MAG TPA: hypothetical protein PL166_09690 [Candidatus Contendobacter sp.]|nr:hypothetical protein [Candidatus Contendobacter sp.]HRD49856.1 hypothetical protein [Candidatus Contendobacter sp.]